MLHNIKYRFQSFYNLIDTVYKDQHFTMFETDAELFGYCYGVAAGTVGEVLTPILVIMKHIRHAMSQEGLVNRCN